MATSYPAGRRGFAPRHGTQMPGHRCIASRLVDCHAYWCRTADRRAPLHGNPAASGAKRRDLFGRAMVSDLKFPIGWNARPGAMFQRKSIATLVFEAW